MDRVQRPMPMELFKKLIDEAAALKIPDLCPNGFGEIMTVRNLEPYLDYISSKSHKFNIRINTNGYRMTEEKIELLIKHKVSLLNICIDGATAETFESIRVGLKLDQIEANIKRLMAIRRERKLGYPKIRVGFVKIPQNVHEIPQFLAKWEGKVDFLGLDGYSNRAGSLIGKFEEIKPETPDRTCLLPFKELNIWADGKAVLCCNDWNEEALVGDLNTQTISEIWQGEALKLARRLHKEKRGPEMKICSSCNYWIKPTPGSRLWV
jgi:radical SAM protein with 4Fe4S-binding SPASM domain